MTDTDKIVKNDITGEMLKQKIENRIVL